MATTKLSPFAPKTIPDVPPIGGVRFAACEAGIRYKGRRDLMIAVMDEGTVVGGVTTRSKTCSAPVLKCREGLRHGRARALVVNSGNANAFTGRKGREAVDITCDAAARAVGCSTDDIYVASTGVIGEPMDAAKFAHLLGDLARGATPTARPFPPGDRRPAARPTVPATRAARECPCQASSTSGRAGIE